MYFFVDYRSHSGYYCFVRNTHHKGHKPMTPQETVKTTKSGTDLETFSDVNLVKYVPKVAPVTSLHDFMARIGNDEKEAFALMTQSLQAKTTEAARKSDDGWVNVDEDGKETTYSGTLVDSKILNPFVLALARINYVPVIRNGKEVEITWDDAKDADEKRAIKTNVVDQIRNDPKAVANLKRRMQAAQAEG
jgi:hypothetical protein